MPTVSTPKAIPAQPAALTRRFGGLNEAHPAGNARRTADRAAQPLRDAIRRDVKRIASLARQELVARFAAINAAPVSP